MVMGMRLDVEMQMWSGTGTAALLHTHCCAEPYVGG